MHAAASSADADAPPRPGDAGADAPAAGGHAGPRVVVSEIMYHPVLANLDDNHHEFVEVHNPGPRPIVIGGWRLSGEITFTFPPGTVLGPDGYLVVARNRARLLEVAAYDLVAIADRVIGDFGGALDDRGGRILLQDAEGTTVDEAAYDDEPPWPLGADGLGGGVGWFEERAWFAAGDPRSALATHARAGISLERVAPRTSGIEAASWAPSPLDGATPGRPRSAEPGGPLPIVERMTVGPARAPDSRLIHADDPVVVAVSLGRGSPIASLEIERYVEFERARPAALPQFLRVPMTPGPDGYRAVLPPMPERTVVRFRIVAAREDGKREALAPRPSDPVPHGHHLYYVSPRIPGRTYYEILISPENWGRLWNNISPHGPVIGCASEYGAGCMKCTVNPSWDARVPAIFVAEGQAHDVRARYTGSMEGRTLGHDFRHWPEGAPRPSAGPLRSLSWSLRFPRYQRFEGMARIILNRLFQSCPGFQYHVAHRLYESDLGGRVPMSRLRRFARLFVNGVPYNYVVDIEPLDEEMLRRFHGRRSGIGELYKLESTGEDLGPWAAGFGQSLRPNPHCPGIDLKTRYEKTYSRKTYEWRGPDDVIALVRGMSEARQAGAERLRAFVQETFDVDATLKYYAVQQWGAPWDDNGKNYNLYRLPPELRRPGNGGWTLTPWDPDRMFGVLWCGVNDCSRADISVWCGTEERGEGRLPRCNHWKRAFLEAFKPEYDAKLRQLNETLLRPDSVRRIVDEVAGTFDIGEAVQMAARLSCNVTREIENMKTFADRRYKAVKAQLGY